MAKPREAGSKERVRTRDEYFEIVGITGTVEFNGDSVEGGEVTRHLHLSLADENGSMWGGHMLSSSAGTDDSEMMYPIYTTAEVGLLVDEHARFHREDCALSGWPELVVRDA